MRQNVSIRPAVRETNPGRQKRPAAAGRFNTTRPEDVGMCFYFSSEVTGPATAPPENDKRLL